MAPTSNLPKLSSSKKSSKERGWRRLFVHCQDIVRSPCCSRCATFTISMQAWRSAGRIFFCASWVERCDKTPIHTKDTLRVAPLWSCVMDSQGRAPPRSKQNRLVHGCVHNVGWLIFPSKLAPVVVCSLECDPLIVHILTSSFVTCCGCEMSLPMLFCAVIVEIDFMSSLPCGKKLKFCTLYLRSATVSTSSQFCHFLCEFPKHGVVSTGRAPPSLAMAVVATLIVFVCSPKAKR